MVVRRLSLWLASVGLLIGAVAMNPITAAANETEFDCPGGPIPPGVYDAVEVSGFCFPTGDVTVLHDVTVKPGATLVALIGTEKLTVGGNLRVESGASAAIGCEPEAFPCRYQPATTATSDSIAGNVIADHALRLLLHHDFIGGNVEQHAGGGGLTCAPILFGPPPYSTYEDNTIGRDASVSDLRTCWVGFFRNKVGGNVEWHNNQTLDPDGNEIASNTIQGNLDCSNNTPPPQLGDSITVGNGPNTVLGKSTGQCPPVVIAS